MNKLDDICQKIYKKYREDEDFVGITTIDAKIIIYTKSDDESAFKNKTSELLEFSDVEHEFRTAKEINSHEVK
jgi:hypothetical protein